MKGQETTRAALISLAAGAIAGLLVHGEARADVAPRDPADPCLLEKQCPDGGFEAPLEEDLREFDRRQASAGFERRCVRVVPAHLKASGPVSETKVAVMCRKQQERTRSGCATAPSGAGSSAAWTLLALGALALSTRRRLNVLPEAR
ncbi:hypothetical protein [Polyangium fumosum]|uniref:Uncharacterized protein n=1 Tax=Polyangium fumosum TaxID=889272 RepID=A0A4U1JKU4_9BACT|nr:hypothetical protein [Polyangium fumosum]TKD12477.1 hypothetical protein E8A74_05115 [Polyangium fumosum]